MRAAAWSLLLSVVACQSPSRTVTLRIELPQELAGRGAELKVQPQIAEARREVARGALALELKRHAGKVTLTLPFACPAVLDTRKLQNRDAISLRSLFRLGPAARVVGLGQRFEIIAEPECLEAKKLDTSFEIQRNASLSQIELGRDGRSFSAVSASVPPESDRAGIIAVSAREQQRLEARLAFRMQLADGTSLTRDLSVAAVARSSGLPNVGLLHPVLLSNDGWRLFDKPPGSRAAVRGAPGFAELVPDVPGTYRLRDAAEHELTVRSGRYDQTPLDCGRSGCHAEIARSAHDSPMTRVLESDLGGCHELGDPTCAIGCHTTGEPGTADGGFSHVMHELAITALPSDYEALPRALRRLGGVGCMACHGPTKLPDPEQRERLLGNDVCAVCHDSPPRYGHVVALEASRMGHADRIEATRHKPCARCHTAWGALGYDVPLESTSFGITCATCHDVHPRKHAPQNQDGLLRELPRPSSLGELPASFDGVSRVCVSCHAPSAGAKLPEASAAAIVAGRGGRDPTSENPLRLAAPHASAERGCLSCHDSGPAGLVLGKTHGFVATEQACSRCHVSSPPRDPELRGRALQLLGRLAPALSAPARSGTWHEAPGDVPRSPSLARALFNVLLVLEDRAADVHNPAYAKLLLDTAEKEAPR